MTIKLNDVQASLIAKLKSVLPVTSLLPDPLDIREVEWQGTDFSYPNIRVRVSTMKRNTPNANCKLFDVNAEVYIFADDASSMLVNDIASAVYDLFDTVSFTQGLVKFIGMSAVQHGAMWVEENGIWRSEVSLQFMAS